jgi:hypothetical protein
MAKLVVARPRLGWRWDIDQRFDVLIDGKPTATIGLEETIVIDLPPGPHQVNARVTGAGSQPVLVDGAPEETLRLAVGMNVSFHSLMSWSLILGMLPFVGLVVWLLIDGYSLMGHIASGGTVSSHRDLYGAWKMALLVPTALLIIIPLLAFPEFLRNHSLLLTKIPDPDVTVEQIAELLRECPFHVRISIRQLMIVVAISALGFWISLEVFRSGRASEFKSQASLHADLEEVFREQNAAKADYHAAMKRKYAQAVAKRLLSVEPDPSAAP